MTPIPRKALSKRQAPPSPAAGLLKLIQSSLDDDQAEAVAVIDMAGKSAIADYMVIATGRSSRHVASMAEHLRESLKPQLGRTPPIEGLTQGDWVLVDASDVVIHLFRAEVRAFYNLEKMWSRALPDSEDWMVGLVKERADAERQSKATKKPARPTTGKKPAGKAVTKKPVAKKPTAKKPAAKKPVAKSAAKKSAMTAKKTPPATVRRRRKAD